MIKEKTSKADGAKSKVEEELTKGRAELSSSRDKSKEELDCQRALHEETKTSLAPSKKGRVEYFVANQ